MPWSGIRNFLFGCMSMDTRDRSGKALSRPSTPIPRSPKTPATWRHPGAFGDALYSIGPSNIPSPSPPYRSCPEQNQTPTEKFQPRYLPPPRCSSAIPLSQESPQSKRILLDGGELSCFHPFNWKSASVPRARWKPSDGPPILAIKPFSPRFIRRSSNSSNSSNLPP